MAEYKDPSFWDYLKDEWIPGVDGPQETKERKAHEAERRKYYNAVTDLEHEAVQGGNEWAAQHLANNGYMFDPDTRTFFRPTSGWGGTAGSIIGGVGGTLGGGALGGPGGALGGGMAGGAAGGAAGEALEAKFSEDPRTKPNIWGEAAWGALPGGITGAAVRGSMKQAGKKAAREAAEAAAKRAAKNRKVWRESWEGQQAKRLREMKKANPGADIRMGPYGPYDYGKWSAGKIKPTDVTPKSSGKYYDARTGRWKSGVREGSRFDRRGGFNSGGSVGGK